MSSAIPTDSATTVNSTTPANPNTPANTDAPANSGIHANPGAADPNADGATAGSAVTNTAAAGAPLRPLAQTRFPGQAQAAAQAQFPRQTQFPGQTATPLSAPLNPAARFDAPVAFNQVAPGTSNPRREKRRFIILLIVIALLCGVGGGVGGAAIMESFSRPGSGSYDNMQTGRGRYGAAQMPDEDQSSGSSTSDSATSGDSITA